MKRPEGGSRKKARRVNAWLRLIDGTTAKLAVNKEEVEKGALSEAGVDGTGRGSVERRRSNREELIRVGRGTV